VRVRHVTDPAEWAAIVGGSPRGGVLQSYEWGEFKALLGWRAIRLLLEDDGRLCGGAQLLLRSSPLGTVAYVPRGPLVAPDDAEGLEAAFSALHDAARAAGAFFLKIEPDWPHSPELVAALGAHGFCVGSNVQPRSTIVVDLSAPSDVLFSRLTRQARYNVRLAQRHGLRCEEGSAADLPEFYSLLEETARRAHFYVHPAGYYSELWRRFAERDAAHLLLVRSDAKALAATLFLVTGGTAYQLYSGSAAEGRRHKPNDLLQWGALLRAGELGCRAYDLWGIPDEVVADGPESYQPDFAGRTVARTFAGVYLFKRNFGGVATRTVGAFDYAYSPARYRLWRALLPTIGRVREFVADRGTARERTTQEAYGT
jgi:peptidoglycan pentaglycine glycine transferase (the first glycine)